jgi:GntR family transcriptional regulator/MocR family aminotransferase
MRRIYLKKRNQLIQSLNSSFGDQVTISGAEAGLHLVASFRGILFNHDLLQKIEGQGIQIATVRKHYLASDLITSYDNSLVFGYGNTSLWEMTEGIHKLYSIMNES